MARGGIVGVFSSVLVIERLFHSINKITKQLVMMCIEAGHSVFKYQVNGRNGK